MAKQTPKALWSDRIGQDVFGNDFKGHRNVAWIAEKLGVPKQTVYSWRREPWRIPAWQYERLMNITGER